MGSNCSRCKEFSKDLICSIMMKLICEISCSELLKWIAKSQARFFFSMVDLWLQVAFGTSGQINNILR